MKLRRVQEEEDEPEEQGEEEAWEQDEEVSEEQIPEPPRKKRPPVEEVADSQPMEEDGWGQPVPAHLEASPAATPVEPPTEEKRDIKEKEKEQENENEKETSEAPVLAAEVPGNLTMERQQQSQITPQESQVRHCDSQGTLLFLCCISHEKIYRYQRYILIYIYIRKRLQMV